TFYFLPAEDGIRGFHVTGVQTCALPILYRIRETWVFTVCTAMCRLDAISVFEAPRATWMRISRSRSVSSGSAVRLAVFPPVAKRSEERRVGKACSAGGMPRQQVEHKPEQ